MAKNPEKSGGIVLPVLLSVLAAAVISAGGFGAGFGVGRVVYGTAAQQVQTQAVTDGQQAAGASARAGSVRGPNVREDYGMITWLSDTWPSNPNRTAGSALAAIEPEASSSQSGQSSTATPSPSTNGGSSSSGKVTLPTTQPQSNGITGARDFSGGRVLATTASNNNDDPVYHTKNCSAAQKIAASDEKWYNSAAEAEADGRRLCGNCAK